MAINPAPKRSRYCPVALGPAPGQLNQPHKQFETLQLREVPYRGAVKIGHSPTYKNTHAKPDKRKGDL